MTGADIDRLDMARWEAAYPRVCEQLLRERTAAGHWVGELSTSALSTATAISALATLREAGLIGGVSPERREQLTAGGLAWLDDHQNADGGFGDTDRSVSNVSTTQLVLAAWRLAGAEGSRRAQVERAQRYVQEQGGIAGIRRRYGTDKTFAVPILANSAIAGLVSWREVSALPFEAAVVPQSWYRFLSLPVVSYAIPALVAIGQAKHAKDPTWFLPWRWLRSWATARSRRVLSSMQPESGGFLEAIPLTSFVVMGLVTAGAASHEVVAKGVRFIDDSVRSDGSWPIDTNLATWTTNLAVLALAQGSEIRREQAPEWMSDSLLDWIQRCQHQVRHPFTGARPGGWGWTDLSGAVPDADDTPAALLALAAWARVAGFPGARRLEIEQQVDAGLEWLLALQNRDGGWPTFCRGWGKLPFDRSGSDLTAHALRALQAWKERLAPGLWERAVSRGCAYLRRQQRADGSWLPLWFGNQDAPDDENPWYGTVKVLAAWRDLKRMDDPAARAGLSWLLGEQRADGSWGGGASIAERWGGETGTIEETALAVELLLSLPRSLVPSSAWVRGGQWLVDRVEDGTYREPSPIGFYFAKLWYHERLYPQIFMVSALARLCGTSVAESPSVVSRPESLPT